MAPKVPAFPADAKQTLETFAIPADVPSRRDSARLGHLTHATIGILTLAILYTCYFTQEALLPVVLAFLLALLLSSLVGFIERLYLPRAAAALVVLLVLICGFGAGVYGLAQPAQTWVKNIPEEVHTLQQRFEFLSGPFHQAQKVQKKIEAMTSSQPAGSAMVVSSGKPGVFVGALSSVPHVLGNIGVIIVLTYFLLSTGDNFLRRMVSIAPGLREKKFIVGMARDIQVEISRYLLTIGAINFGLGCATAAAMALLGLSNPLLWGAVAALFNFAPYVGPLATIVALALAGLSSFDSLGHALAVPGVFLLLAICEGQFITPYIVGRRLDVNPAFVFLWLLLWGSLWGLIGLLLAGPLLACFSIVCQYVPSLHWVYVMISNTATEKRAEV